MVVENQVIELFGRDSLLTSQGFSLRNCIVKKMDLFGYESDSIVVIENCVIDNLTIQSCWFRKGIIFKNNIVNGYIDYQMGGHNEAPVVIEENVFVDFFNFFDCQFGGIIEIRNNIFKKGTNILGNKGLGFENTFSSGCLIEDNIGRVDVDGEGEPLF